MAPTPGRVHRVLIGHTPLVLSLLTSCGFRPEEGTYAVTDVIGRLECWQTGETVTTIEDEGGELVVSGVDRELFNLHLGSCPGGMCTTLDVSCVLGEVGELAFACDPIIDADDQMWGVSGVWLSTTALQAQLTYDSCSEGRWYGDCACLGDWFFDAALAGVEG